MRRARILLLSGGACAIAALVGSSFLGLRSGEAPGKYEPGASTENTPLEIAVAQGTVDLPSLGSPNKGEVKSAPGIALAQRMAFITGTSLTVNLDDETRLVTLGGNGNHVRVRRQGHSLVYLSPGLPAAAMGVNTVELDGGGNTLDFTPTNKASCGDDFRIGKDVAVVGFRSGQDHIRLPCSIPSGAPVRLLHSNGQTIAGDDIDFTQGPVVIDLGSTADGSVQAAESTVSLRYQSGGHHGASSGGTLVFLVGTTKGDTEIYHYVGSRKAIDAGHAGATPGHKNQIEPSMLWHLATLTGVGPAALNASDFQ